MRFSIWLMTFGLNTILLGLMVSSLWEPFGVPAAVQLVVVFVAYAVLGLFYLGLRQTDDGETRQAIAEMRLHGHQWGVEAGKRPAVEYGKRHGNCGQG